MEVGSRSDYVMTGPDGATSAGFWTFLEAVPQVVTTISNYAKQGADCPAAAINKSSN